MQRAKNGIKHNNFEFCPQETEIYLNTFNNLKIPQLIAFKKRRQLRQQLLCTSHIKTNARFTQMGINSEKTFNRITAGNYLNLQQ